jgi:selenocysteine lyase/cysteine desulfurase
MAVDRRNFLRTGGVALGAGLTGAACQAPAAKPLAKAPAASPRGAPLSGPAGPRLDTWEGVRALFPLTRDAIYLAGMFFVSHPTPVREAIEAHRRGLDENPFEYVEERFSLEGEVRKVAGEFLGVEPGQIALTDSTTMGLGLVYGGLRLNPGDEILTSTHDHFVTEFSLRYCSERTGAKVRRIKLYDGPEAADADRIVRAVAAGLTPKTRVVALTWVHSSSGVKLPLSRIAEAIAKHNAGRDEKDRALFCVDGVHGLGVDDFKMADLGCDFFVAGCHKWLFGPRGTGLVWGSAKAWARVRPDTSSFDSLVGAWIRGTPVDEIEIDAPRIGSHMTPGGFHSFEHRWALPEAFRLHERVGRARIAARVHALNRQFKEGIRGLPNATLRTPLSDDLSAGLSCFEVKGLDAEEVIKRLHAQHIVATVPPYPKPYARVSPGVFNTPDEIDATLRAIRALG